MYIYNSGPEFLKTLAFFFFFFCLIVSLYLFFLIVRQLIYTYLRFRDVNDPQYRFNYFKTIDTFFPFVSLYTER